MARRIDGYVLRLRCTRCERKFPHVIFSGDTDMATDGLCSLTAVGQDEVVIGEFDASERRLDYDGAERAFAERISQLLGRNDLRVIRLLRSEPSSSPRGKYTAPRTIYSCPICPSGEAQEIEKMEWERFRAIGGQITIIGDMELLAGQMAEPGWTEVKRLLGAYTVTSLPREAGPAGNYRYAIWKDGQQVAEFRHDYRGDECRISIKTGPWIEVPFILSGGGPDPWVVTETGARFLDAHLCEGQGAHPAIDASGHAEDLASTSSAPNKPTRSRFALWAVALVATILALWVAAIIAANFGIEFSLPRLR